jgi:benzoyl-CoA reductase subunit A
MKVYVGIDLGSTTTKAVVLDETGRVLGRGITNSRSNYEVACRIARDEAFVRARFNLIRAPRPEILPALARKFRYLQHLEQLDRLRQALRTAAGERPAAGSVEDIVQAMREAAAAHFNGLAQLKSDFFRDLAAADYMHAAEQRADPKGVTFETLCSLFDAAILTVENSGQEGAFERHILAALDLLNERSPELRAAVEQARATPLEEAGAVGTGYGRQRLPFPKEQTRSEILCHGLGAHAMFPATRTVLDIGGQDTKAIQVDAKGIVTSFQMNDRCAAGCGRYLGYIADEMNLGLHELGPLAQQSGCRVKINSTCTVFAGAELRERLSLGQRREDILAGLHRAIILRAMSLLARSGGVAREFTFTGGVARNPAAVQALRELIQENYNVEALNISPDSIYTGALGAALFARRAAA